jgi:ariadne-1
MSDDSDMYGWSDDQVSNVASDEFGSPLEHSCHVHADDDLCLDLESTKSDSDDGDDGDYGFADFTEEKRPSKSFEVEFQVLSDSDIRKRQEEQIQQIQSILGLSLEKSAVLLRHFKWNKEGVIDRFMEDPDALLSSVGISSDGGKSPLIQTASIMCEICCDDSGNLKTFSLSCCHRYCVDCYQQYLTQKIKEEGESRRITCPSDKCNLVFDEKSVQLLVTPDVFDR